MDHDIPKAERVEQNVDFTRASTKHRYVSRTLSVGTALPQYFGMM